MNDLIERFLDHQWQSNRMAENSLAAYRRDLQKIERRLQAKQTTLQMANTEDLAEVVYDENEARSTQMRTLSACRQFYLWMVLSDLRIDNPITPLKGMKKIQSLPKFISEEQIDALLAAPDITKPHGLRDKALLELIYASGLRVSEAVKLQYHEIHWQSGMLNLIGKGGKQRIVPVGEEAIYWLERYWNEARDLLLKGTLCEAFFVSQKKVGITRQLAWQLVKNYATMAGIHQLSPHSLRHAFATHLVNHGTDLRMVQMMLGHSDIGTTQIYTHVANIRMQQIVQQHHPRS